MIQQNDGKSAMPPITRKRKRDSERAAINCLMIKNTGYFKMLPAEIMEVVLGKLDAPSLSSISCTCRKLNEYTQKMWKVLCLKMSLDYTPTPLCLGSPTVASSMFQYDVALRKCTNDETKWRIMAIRHWLYCRWRCVVCYKSCTQRLDPHRDILLCDSCHPVFYKRKSSAKEQFGLTERDLNLIVNNGFEYLMTDLIFLARTKYGGKDGLEQRLKERKHLKMKREAEKECSLVKKESEVVDALLRHGSSYSEVRIVDSRFMPYVSIPTTYRRCSSQTADDAARWLISMKNRYEARYKALMEQILIQSSKCKGCSNSLCTRPYSLSACCHMSNDEAFKTFTFIKENFAADIQTYMKTGLLNEAQNGPVDCENWATTELLERAKRKENLKKALQDLKSEWPAIVQEGLKEPLQCSMAEDFIQKGVLILQHQNGRCRLKKAQDVSRVILAAARGWQNRSMELKIALEAKGLTPPFETLKSECKTLIDDYVDHMVIVRNGSMVACSASEVVNEITKLQGLSQEQKMLTSVNSRAIILNEHVPGEDLTSLAGRRQAIKKKFPEFSYLEDLYFSKSIVENYIKIGNINSLFGYKLTTPEAVMEVIKLKERLFTNATQCNTSIGEEKGPSTTTETC